MNKLFKTYVVSICIVILGQLIYASFASSIICYFVSIPFIIFLFMISLKTELMEKKEFLFIQLVLVSTFFIYELTSLPVISAFMGGINFINSGFSMQSFIMCTSILKLLGYAVSIICLIKYNFNKK